MRSRSWLAHAGSAVGLIACVAAHARAQSPEQAKVLARIKAADSDLLAVSEEDGRFLRLMVATSRAKRALEIGGANGYSAIWIGLGLRDTGGRLTTIEYDPARARAAAENIRQGRPRRHRHGGAR